MKTYYITTAIMYPNAKPHIGFAYELVIADFLARWHRLCSDDVFFLTGTDEHGQKIADAAKKANKTPRQFVDYMVKFVIDLAKKLNTSNDSFIRTTQKKHWKTAADVFTKVFDKGLIYKGKYEGLYCTGCEAYYTEKDLVDGLCPNHKTRPKKVSEESYFFKMSEFQDKLVSHINNNPNFIQPEFRRKEILNRLKEPLRDLSVSRKSLKWGIPMPQDKNHVLYVWFDALLNYFSGISYPTRKFIKFWPADCHVIGKDIIWFHTVIWPTMLMAAGFELPKKILIHGFLTHDGHKMSKSLGNVVDPFEVLESCPADSLRYVLLRDVPAGQDGDFSETNLVARHNGDLADGLGNLLQRTSVLIHKNFKGVIPICGTLTNAEKELNEFIPDVKELKDHINNCNWNHAVEVIWNYIRQCNKYVNDSAPWKIEDKKRLGTVLYTLIEHLRIVSILVCPIIPESAEKLARQINQPIGKLKDVRFTKTTKGFVAEPEILFSKLEPPKKEEDAFSKLDLKIGIVKKAEQHPNADKLFVLDIDAGKEKRQIVSGLQPFYRPEELVGRHVVFVSNLKPAKFRGVESQGMMLSAEKGDVVKVLEAPESVPGEQVFVEGISPKPGIIKIDDFAGITLKVKNRKVFYKDKKLKTNKEPLSVDISDGAVVK